MQCIGLRLTLTNTTKIASIRKSSRKFFFHAYLITFPSILFQLFFYTYNYVKAKKKFNLYEAFTSLHTCVQDHGLLHYHRPIMTFSFANVQGRAMTRGSLEGTSYSFVYFEYRWCYECEILAKV